MNFTDEDMYLDLLHYIMTARNEQMNVLAWGQKVYLDTL
jgi:hypothetical protein